MLKPQIIAAVLGGLLVGYSAGRLTRVGPTSVPSETEVGFDLAKALSAATAPPPQEDSDWACFEGGREPEPGCPRPLLKRMSLLPRTPSAHSGIEDGPFCGLKKDLGELAHTCTFAHAFTIRSIAFVSCLNSSTPSL